MTTETEGYRPGHCNIGARQRRSRLVASFAGFALALLVVLAVASGSLPRELLVGVFVPLAVGYEWGLQASSAFCVRLAVLSRYDFGPGATGTVADPDARRVDQVQAVKITAIAVLLAAVTTAFLVVLLG